MKTTNLFSLQWLLAVTFWKITISPLFSHALTNPLVIRNYKFFDEQTGESVNLKGAAYYPRPNAGEWDINNHDFFTDEFRHVWEADIARFVELGLNAIRIYAVNPGKSHDSFMCALQEAGIYVIVGLAANCWGCAITNDAPPLCYPPELKTRGHLVIGAFAKYDNVLGFSAGNEVALVNWDALEQNAPCQKKFVRDMRAYLANCPHARKIPIGVVIADVDRADHLAYYNCGSDLYETAEWLGINTYVDCIPTETKLEHAPGMQGLARNLATYSIPAVAAEFGCINPEFLTVDGYAGQRHFYPAEWMHEPGMNDTIAGSFVFEYSVEKRNSLAPYPFDEYGNGNFGIGYYSPEHCNHGDVPCTYIPKPEFDNLQAAYEATPTRGVDHLATFQPDPTRLARSACPSHFQRIELFTWEADAVPLYCPGVTAMTCAAPTTTPQQQQESATSQPSSAPLNPPSPVPTDSPTPLRITPRPSSSRLRPSATPTMIPSSRPSWYPTNHPTTPSPTTMTPTNVPSDEPSDHPSSQPTHESSSHPSDSPSNVPSEQPSKTPSSSPTIEPSTHPSEYPSDAPSTNPTNQPSDRPSRSPLLVTTASPSTPTTTAEDLVPEGSLKQARSSSSDGTRTQPSAAITSLFLSTVMVVIGGSILLY